MLRNYPSKVFIESMSIPEPNSGCWLWQGDVTVSGYGRFKAEEIRYYAHRVSFTVFKGEIPKRLLVRHLCHNKACVNPEHLAVGTQQDNMADSKDRPRKRLLTKEQVEEIRELHKSNKRNVYRKLAVKFNVSPQTIWRTVNGYPG